LFHFKGQSFDEFCCNYKEFSAIMETIDTFNELSREEKRFGHQVIPVDLLKLQQYQGSYALAFTTMSQLYP